MPSAGVGRLSSRRSSNTKHTQHAGRGITHTKRQEGTGRHATLLRVLERLDREEGVPSYDLTNLSGIEHAAAATGP